MVTVLLRATGIPIPFLFMACQDHYQNPCEESSPTFCKMYSPQCLILPLPGHQGYEQEKVQTLYQNVNTCPNDIVYSSECYSNWLVVIHTQLTREKVPTSFTFIMGQVFLTGSWLLFIGASSRLVKVTSLMSNQIQNPKDSKD